MRVNVSCMQADSTILGSVGVDVFAKDGILTPHTKIVVPISIDGIVDRASVYVPALDYSVELHVRNGGAFVSVGCTVTLELDGSALVKVHRV